VLQCRIGVKAVVDDLHFRTQRANPTNERWDRPNVALRYDKVPLDFVETNIGEGCEDHNVMIAMLVESSFDAGRCNF